MDPRSVLLGLLELIAPLRCPGCDLRVDRDSDADLPLDPHASAFCDACWPALELFPGVEAVYAYGGPLADAIKRLKYDGRMDTLSGLTRLMERAYPSVVGTVDMVVSVPLHPRKRIARGFDQSALLVQPLAKALGVPLRRNVLRRVRDTPAQAHLDAEARDRNVLGAFEGKGLRGERVLLFDDVRTTGATLDAASAALFEAGAGSVVTLSLAGRV